MLRNAAYGPEIGLGRAATGEVPKSALRPAFGRPEGRSRYFPGSSPAKIQPGRPISVPEAPLRNIEYNAVLSNCTPSQLLRSPRKRNRVPRHRGGRHGHDIGPSDWADLDGALKFIIYSLTKALLNRVLT